MTRKSDRILVLCPGNAVTGGPEVLHQLVHELRAQGKDAAICYFPFSTPFEIPGAYRCYDVEVAQFVDRQDQTVVIPETATRLLDQFDQSKAFIWWLSVDNFFGRFESRWKSELMQLLEGGWSARRQCIGALEGARHLAQSAYALDFLHRHGLHGELLTDYLAQEHFARRTICEERKNSIAYNPKKGAKTIANLRRLLPDLHFIPIRGMTKHEVAKLLSSVKIYADFGHHPGKDRLPREAAMAGACVITGLRGSASFQDDVPIPDRYKLDDQSPHLAAEFDEIARSIFAAFDQHDVQFESYREVIRQERDAFVRQVAELF